MTLVLRKFVFSALISMLLIACSNNQQVHYDSENKSNLYSKIIRNFATDDGLLKTDLKGREHEYLAESQGLLLEYFLQQNMRENFQLAMKVTENQLLLKNNTVSWQKINDEKSPTNALIDDLRIIEVLMAASEKWEDSHAKKLANQLIEGNMKHTLNDGYLVNYSSNDENNRTDEINLSYVNKNQYDYFNFPKEQLEKQMKILEETPFSKNGFYPLKFMINDKTYTFEKKVHMVDQLLTAINRAAVNPDDHGFYEQLKNRFNRDGKIFGMYHLKTGKPSVRYESPAVYSYAIQLARIHHDVDFENKLMQRLNALKNHHEDSPFYGTFIEESSKETHVFDNLMPLLIEEGN